MMLRLERNNEHHDALQASGATMFLTAKIKSLKLFLSEIDFNLEVQLGN